MPAADLAIRVPGVDPAAAYAALTDFERYPALTDAVRDVTVEDGGRSRWEVNFREGILRWTEIDVLDAEARTIAFEQESGDFHAFRGAWIVDDDPAGSVVRFHAEFDLGIPSLSELIDPLAVRALRDNVAAIVSGLFGRDVEAISRRPSSGRFAREETAPVEAVA